MTHQLSRHDCSWLVVTMAFGPPHGCGDSQEKSVSSVLIVEVVTPSIHFPNATRGCPMKEVHSGPLVNVASATLGSICCSAYGEPK